MGDGTGSRRLDDVVASARQARETRERGYRERALALYPWVCGRCGRGFERGNLRELTVHHRDHDHDNNPEDGSNWELLCLYCHDNEHRRVVDAEHGALATDTTANGEDEGKHRPFAALLAALKRDENDG